jgi:hypothetical protein
MAMGVAVALAVGWLADAATAGEAKLAPIPIDLPRPMFKGTPKNVRYGPRVQKLSDKPRQAFLAPEGATNVALKKRVTASDEEPIIGEIPLVTDGDKEGTEGSFVELGPGLQWVQIDLAADYQMYAVVIWHYHAEARVYHDVVVQVADDADFITNVRAVFNSDHDNSAGLGIGQDMEYIETHEGLLIDAKGVKARYIRLYSKGNTSSDMNHYTEVEVWGVPAK